MPLDESGSKKAIGANIKAEQAAHPTMPHKQAVAIAMSVDRKAHHVGARKPTKPRVGVKTKG